MDGKEETGNGDAGMKKIENNRRGRSQTCPGTGGFETRPYELKTPMSFRA